MAHTTASLQQGNDDRSQEDAGGSSSSSSNGGSSSAASASASSGFQPGGGNGSSSGSSSSGGGGSNGGNGIRRPSSWSGGDSGGRNSGPFGHMSPQLLARSVLALAALSGVLLAAVVKLLLAESTQERLLEALSRQAASNTEASSTSEAIAALKRLLREVFAEQLGTRGRLTALEKAAAAQLEAGDDYALQQQGVDGSSGGWKRAPVRFSGFLSAAGVLPWSQEADGAAALAMLSALGAGGQAAGRLQLHSVLAGGKRRITAELAPAEAAGAAAAAGGPVMQLQQLLYRVEVKPWLQLMIAPLGGGLHALARGITPIVGDFGCSATLRQGHGLTALSSSTGSGKAVSCRRGRLSAAAGFFVGGAGKSAVGQLQLRGREGAALSLVAASRRPNRGPCSSGSEQHPAPVGLRFLGTQAPGCLARSSSCQEGGPAPSSGHSSVVGLAGVLPLADALTATAWAERGSVGSSGWGLGLYSQPDQRGVELGMVLAKPPSASHAAFGAAAAPVFCELAAKVPVGDGLSIAPGALVAFRGAGASVAFCMGSSWRF